MLHRIFSTMLLIIVISSCAIAQEEELYGEFGPYATIPIDGDKYVPHGEALIIHYGSTVEFEGHYHIRVEYDATLTATGTDNEPVIFTADTPQHEYPGFWNALIAEGSSENPATMNLTNCEIRYGGEHETSFQNTSGPVRANNYCTVIVDNCYIHHNWGDGVGVNYDTRPNNLLQVKDTKIEECETGTKLASPADESYFKRNRITACGLGMYVHADFGTVIANNIIENSTECGARGDFAFFRNNIVAGTQNGGNGIEIINGAEENAIVNNILKDNTGWGIFSPVAVTVRNNCYHGNGGSFNRLVTSLDHVLVDPLFAAGFGDDNYYHLRWNSPCLGWGWDQLTNCNLAHSRSDIGAYGGPELEEPPYEEGLYWVVIADYEIHSTPEHPSLNQDASPYHVLSGFDVDPNNDLFITAEGSPCELHFDAWTNIGVLGNLTVTGNSEDEQVFFKPLEGASSPWPGLLLGAFGVISENTLQYADISGANNGIIASYAKLSLNHCNIHHSVNTGICAEFMKLYLSNSTISNNGRTGIFIWPQAQVMALRNTISDNGFSGVGAFQLSKFIADYNADIIPVNYIHGNGHADPGLYHQIDLYDRSGALMKEGHNQITSDIHVLVEAIDCTTPNPVTLNWWGEPNPPGSRFEPTYRWRYLPCDQQPWGEDEGGRSAAELAFANAIALEESGNYLAAEAAYRNVVANYTTDALASEALTRTFYCTQDGNGNFNSQGVYYRDLADTCSVAIIAKFASELEWRSLVEVTEYQDALDQCEAVIANPPSLADSVLAVIDVGFIYLAAQANGGGLDALDPVGMFPELKPSSYEDYLQRKDELFALLHPTENQKDERTLVPMGYTLYKPYPNPFNASTRISYSLQDIRNVNIVIFDVLGRKVATLVDDRQAAGDYNVVWSGQSSTGDPVSSGIYFIRMETETGFQSAKMLLLK